jgi:hypothetical protein
MTLSSRQEQRNFRFSISTGSGAQTASYLRGIRRSFTGAEVAVSEAEHLSHLMRRLRICGLYLCSPRIIIIRWCLKWFNN